MRRLERGAGRRRDRRTGPRIRQPALGNSGPRAGAAPAGVLTHSTHSGGVGAPPGDTMVPCQELADDRWARFAPSTKARPAAVVRTPQQSVERRAGLRYWPVISERSRRSTRPRGGSRGAALPHQRLSALCSPPSRCRATEGKPGTAKPGYSGLARRSFSEGGRRSVGCLNN